MTELYLIKYGEHSFDQAFVNAGQQHFVGAKTGGGAMALKHIDREHRNVQAKSSQKMTAAQRLTLHRSVSRFAEHLHGGRGRNRPSKFAGLKTKAEVLTAVTGTLVRRAGFPAAKTASAAATTAVQAAKPKSKGVTKPAPQAAARTKRAKAGAGGPGDPEDPQSVEVPGRSQTCSTAPVGFHSSSR
jgi:hypothetical protein